LIEIYFSEYGQLLLIFIKTLQNPNMSEETKDAKVKKDDSDEDVQIIDFAVD